MRDEIKLLAGAALLFGLIAVGVNMINRPGGNAVPQGMSIGFEQLRLASDLSPISLTAEEQAALGQIGIAFPAGDDLGATSFLRVHTWDDLASIQQDIDGTNLSGIDAESSQIYQDLKGL